MQNISRVNKCMVVIRGQQQRDYNKHRQYQHYNSVIVNQKLNLWINILSTLYRYCVWRISTFEQEYLPFVLLLRFAQDLPRQPFLSLDSSNLAGIYTVWPIE
jgi:hypothetical protein